MIRKYSSRIGIGVAATMSSFVMMTGVASATVQTSDIANGAVTSAKIANGTIQTEDLGANVVRTSNIVNGGVQSADISNGTIVGDDLASDISVATSGTVNVTGAPVNLNESSALGTGIYGTLNQGSMAGLNVDSTLSSTTGSKAYATSARQAATKSIATVAAGFGSADFTDPGNAAGSIGQINGANLTKAYNYTSGAVGAYNITGTNASLMPKAGVVGWIADQTTTADAAVMALLDGDGGTTTARAGFGIMTLNSTSSSGFNYGLDLLLQTVSGHTSSSQAFKKADIRLSSSQEVYSGSATTRAAVRAQAGTQGAVGSIYLSSAGKQYLKVAAAGADTDWQRVTTTAAD